MNRIYYCALALGVPLSGLGAQAEEPPALAAGDRVRVVAPKPVCTYPEAAPCYGQVVGLLQSIDSASIVIWRENGGTVRVSRAPGVRLDVSTGRGACSEHRGSCVVLGLLGGAGVGAAVGLVSVQSQGGARACGENLCELIYWFTVPAGAVLGAIVGAVAGREDWEAADLPARLSVGPAGPGRLALAVSLRL
jgi:hypothetical protein